MSVARYFSVEIGITLSSIAIEKLLNRIDRIGMRSRTAVSKSMPVNPIAASPQTLMHSFSGLAESLVRLRLPKARAGGYAALPARVLVGVEAALAGRFG